MRAFTIELSRNMTTARMRAASVTRVPIAMNTPKALHKSYMRSRALYANVNAVYTASGVKRKRVHTHTRP
jgi:ketosteroid isomerase-like protein